MANEQTTTEITADEYLKIGKITNSFLEKGVSENPPRFIIFMGGVGVGKTTIRHKEYATNYVNFEFGEILNAVKKEFGEDNPKLSSYAAMASDMILRESLENKKNIVIEIIGDNKDLIDPIITKMNDIGYTISIKLITCDPAEALNRHAKAVHSDPKYLSVYFTQEATLSFFYQLLELGEMPNATK